MRHKSQAQSLVEMAMVLPFLLFLCFAIIDMGWYIYGYATIYNSARRGAEEASQLPPWPRSIQDSKEREDTSTNQADGCLDAVFKAVHDQAVMFPDILSPGQGDFDIQYINLTDPNLVNPVTGKPIEIGDAIPNTMSAARAARQLGGIVQVSISYELRPLTPLLTLGKAFGFGHIGRDGDAVLTISNVSRRSIDSLGSNPNYKDGFACQEYPTSSPNP